MHTPRLSRPPSRLELRHLLLWAISPLARLDGENPPTKEVNQTGVTLDHHPILPLHHNPQSHPVGTRSQRPRLLRRHTSMLPPLLQCAEQKPSCVLCSAPSKRLLRRRRTDTTMTEIEPRVRTSIRNAPLCVSLPATQAARRYQSRGPLRLHPARSLRPTPSHASLPSPPMIAFDAMHPHD
jgi:hypothetical protein